MNKPNLLLHTENLLIKPFEQKHLCSEYVAWLNDSDLMKFSEQRHTAHSLESCKTYMDSFENTENYFLALEDPEGRIVGTMTIYRDINNGLADIGIMIGAENSQGKGLGGEAWAATSEWIIRELKPRKITAGCMSSNTAMIKIMEKNGMQVDGVRKKHYIRDGHEEDIIYMAKFM